MAAPDAGQVCSPHDRADRRRVRMRFRGAFETRRSDAVAIRTGLSWFSRHDLPGIMLAESKHRLKQTAPPHHDHSYGRQSRALRIGENGVGSTSTLVTLQSAPSRRNVTRHRVNSQSVIKSGERMRQTALNTATV